MSLLPWAYGAVSPFNVFGADPWSSWDVTPYPRSISSMTPSLRRMERDLGRLISSVKEDDKSFQVSCAYPIYWLFRFDIFTLFILYC